MPIRTRRRQEIRLVNALGDGDYFDGLPVDCPAIDDVTTAVGADDDPRVVAALSILQTGATGACPPAPAAASRAQAATIEPSVSFPESRGNAAREFAGAF